MTKNSNNFKSDSDTDKFWASFPGIIGLDRVLHLDSENKDIKSIKRNQKIWPLPELEKSSSCNVVIAGKAGTGKSTLALHMATALRVVSEKNQEDPKEGENSNATVLYYSLEQSPESLQDKTDKLKPKAFFEKNLLRNDEESLKDIVKEYKKKNTENNLNLVLFPKLSPRRLEQIDGKAESISIFWQRLEEIRNIIRKLQIREKDKETKNDLPPLRMVVIDSLNVFGDKPVTRYLIEQFFTSLSQFGLIALFIIEGFERNVHADLIEADVSPGITYLSDVVIELSWDIKEGYSHRTLNIVKSRHVSNTYGHQFIKIRSSGIEVYPSLHQWHSYLAHLDIWDDLDKRGKLENIYALPDETDDFNSKLNEDLRKHNLLSLVQTIKGPRHTLKGRMVAAYAGVAKDKKGKCLLVSFDVSEDPQEWVGGTGKLSIGPDDKSIRIPALTSKKGVLKKLYTNGENEQGESINIEIGYQLWFVPGYLVGQELVHFIYETLLYFITSENEYITRIIFRDIGQMLSKYPYIASQIREYLPFFTVLLELCRRFAVDCMFVCGSNDKEAIKLCEKLEGLSHLTFTTEEAPHEIKKEYEENTECALLTVNGHFAQKSKGQWRMILNSNMEFSIEKNE